MKIAFFSTQPYDREYFERHNQGHEISFFDVQLNEQTAGLAKGSDAVCAFVNDRLNAVVIKTLAQNGTGIIAQRCAGFNNVDLDAAKENKIAVVLLRA